MMDPILMSGPSSPQSAAPSRGPGSRVIRSGVAAAASLSPPIHAQLWPGSALPRRSEYWYHGHNYSQENITWVKTLGGHISHNKAFNSINLGAKLKPLICTFQNCPWILILTQYWLSYGPEKVQNLNLENAQNESVFEKFSGCFWLFSVSQMKK